MQLSYTTDVVRGYHGQKAEAYPSAIGSYIMSGTYDVGIVLVADRGAGKPDKAAKAPAAAGDLDKPEVLGILLRSELAEPGKTAVNDVRSVMRKGRAWVQTETAVTKYTTAFVRHTAAGAEIAGSLRNDADGTDAVQVAGITFLETTTAAGVVMVEFDL